VPLVALVAILVTVPTATFHWGSLREVVRHAKTSSTVMLATVVLTLATHNLAVGVAVGVLLSGVFFMGKVSQLLQVRCEDDEAGGRIWSITGQVFFASADALVDAFDVRGAEGRAVRIDA